MKRHMTNRGARRACFVLIALLLLLLLGGASLWASVAGLKVTEYAGESPKLSAEIRLALLSDVHDNPWLLENGALVKRVKALAPDIIVLTGDLLNY